MFAALAGFISKRRWTVLVAGIAFLVISVGYGTSLFGQLKGGGFADPAADSTKVEDTVSAQFDKGEAKLLVMFSSDRLKVSDAAYKQALETTLAQVQGQPGVGSLFSYYNTGVAQLLSTDQRSTYAVVGLKGDFDAQEATLKRVRPLLRSDRLSVHLGGIPAINADVNAQVSADLEKAELFTFPLLAILLVFIFGSLVAAALPLAIGGVSILGAFLVLRIVSNFTDVSIFSINVITMLGLGLAIDYSLFIVSRFREELKRQGDTRAALVRTMQTAGRTVMFSGLTVALSLLILLLFPQMFLQSMGMGGAAAVMVAMLTSLTVLPAMLALLGSRVNALSLGRLFRRQEQTTQVTERGFWYNLSQAVMRRPIITLVATLTPLLLLGSPFLHVQFVSPDARSLPKGAESRTVSEMLERDFPQNDNTAIIVLVRGDKPALDAANLGGLYDYTRQLATLAGVTEVRSLVNLDPRLDAAGKQAYLGIYANTQNPQIAAAAARYSSGNYSMVQVLYNSNPQADVTRRLVHDIRSLPTPANAQVQVGGQTAQLVDLLDSLSSRVPAVFGLIVAFIFVLLFLMLGSVFIPLKAVILNLLSLSVSLGALVWIFQDGNFASLLGITPTDGVDATQLVLIFAIAFALSMDYEVFLLSRIKESYDRSGDNTHAVAQGVQKTASIITSAALLLFIVIAAFATGDVVFIKQIGVGLGLAIIVDATLVRLLLVPATMRLMGRYNWWSPRPLRALYNRIGLAEREDEPTDTASNDEPAASKPITVPQAQG